MDLIKVGLDFGTHQTKICLQITPDEGLGEPRYEFFTFKDLKGKSHYTLPSIVQVNEDNTVSYGFVDPSRERFKVKKPELIKVDYMDDDFDIEDEADFLYDKYITSKNTIGDKNVLRSLLEAKKEYAKRYNTEKEEEAKVKFNLEMKEYNKNCMTFRYFKQATFADREWKGIIPDKYVSIWFLSYVIFLLEEKYGQNFSINMGIPADERTYNSKREQAVSVLASAYNLVENVYDGDFASFLAENVLVLFEKTEIIEYSDAIKEEYFINIFPEAYASLTCLTSRGKISPGLCLNADIGGGTTDISFFAVEKNSNQPSIYRYWSLPYGLNYIAEQSGYDYSDIEKVFGSKASRNVVEEYINKNSTIVLELYNDLMNQLKKESTINQSVLYGALLDKVVVYNGGGSDYPFICGPLRMFTIVEKIDKNIWKDVNVKDKEKINKLCSILATSFGLSIGDDDSKVKLSPFTNLFKGLRAEKREERQMIDKDMC